MHPFKWPPDSYYIEQIKQLAHFFNDENLYVFLFTDHDRPAELVEKYQAAVNCDRIVFDCRADSNKHDLNVLEDFFALTRFDCLIRCDSNFSLIASKLGDYKVLIAPTHSILKNNEVLIDEVEWEIEKKLVRKQIK